MWQIEEDYQRTYRSEKERTVVLLGFLSIILAVRVELHEGDFWNFPWWCDNSCAHFTVWLLPTFTNWIILWVGYVACMLIYFSEDKFDKYTWGRSTREFFRRLGNRFFVLSYPVTVLFFSTLGGVSFQLPDLAEVQTPYWLGVGSLLGWYAIWTAEGIIGAKIVGKRSFLRRPLDSFLELGRQGTPVIAEGLVRVWRRVLRHSSTGPIRVKRTLRTFVTVTTSFIVLFAWGVMHLSGFDLLYALGVPLYSYLLASVLIGWRRWKRLSNASLRKIEEG